MRRHKVCSILKRIEIVTANQRAWQALAQFHYHRRHPGVVKKVFAAVLTNGSKAREHSDVVGVIVYGLPVPHCRLRNLATGGRYCGWRDRQAALRLLGEEVRTITRVVVRPDVRGIGLGQRLVRETMPRAGTKLVEALATMGRLNPFFERAGMTRYDGPRPEAAERLLAALAHAEIGAECIAAPEDLAAELARCDSRRRDWLLKEIRRFSEGYLTHRTRRDGCSMMELCEIVSGHVHLQPVYYLWQRHAAADNLCRKNEEQ